jgi:hypothetical protein
MMYEVMAIMTKPFKIPYLAVLPISIHMMCREHPYIGRLTNRTDPFSTTLKKELPISARSVFPTLMIFAAVLLIPPDGLARFAAKEFPALRIR